MRDVLQKMNLFGDHTAKNRFYGFILGPAITILMLCMIQVVPDSTSLREAYTHFLITEIYITLATVGVIWTIWSFGFKSGVDKLLEKLNAKLKYVIILAVSIPAVISLVVSLV